MLFGGVDVSRLKAARPFIRTVRETDLRTLITCYLKERAGQLPVPENTSAIAACDTRAMGTVAEMQDQGVLIKTAALSIGLIPYPSFEDEMM